MIKKAETIALTYVGNTLSQQSPDEWNEVFSKHTQKE